VVSSQKIQGFGPKFFNRALLMAHSLDTSDTSHDPSQAHPIVAACHALRPARIHDLDASLTLSLLAIHGDGVHRAVNPL
jgi:hypothetical protein